MTIELEPLTPVIGAEICGVDLTRPLDDQTFAFIHDAWMEHLVLFLCAQELDLEQLASLGRRFGELYVILPIQRFAQRSRDLLRNRTNDFPA